MSFYIRCQLNKPLGIENQRAEIGLVVGCEDRQLSRGCIFYNIDDPHDLVYVQTNSTILSHPTLTTNYHTLLHKSYLPRLHSIE